MEYEHAFRLDEVDSAHQAVEVAWSDRRGCPRRKGQGERRIPRIVAERLEAVDLRLDDKLKVGFMIILADQVDLGEGNGPGDGRLCGNGRSRRHQQPEHQQPEEDCLTLRPRHYKLQPHPNKLVISVA